jgi:hypothetical protein
MMVEQPQAGRVVRATADKYLSLSRKRWITAGKEYPVLRQLGEGLFVGSDIPGQEALLLPGDFDVVEKE